MASLSFGGGGGSGDMEKATYDSNDDGVIAVPQGGTGVATLTGIVKGSGTGNFAAASQGTDYYAPSGTDVAVADGGTGASTAGDARTNLGLGNSATKDVGTGATNVSAGDHNHSGVYQPSDAQLTDVAGLAVTKGNMIVGDGSNFKALGVGTDTHVLTADAAEASGVKWAAVSAGANTALSNLASVAINTSLISDTDSTDDLGSTTVAWANVFADTYTSASGNDLTIKPDDAQALVIQTAQTTVFTNAIKITKGGSTQLKGDQSTQTLVGTSGYERVFEWNSGYYSATGGRQSFTTMGGLGSFSFGEANATANNYTASFGYGHTTSGQAAFTGGFSNTASGTNAASFGTGNTSSGTNTFTSGSTNTASANYSAAGGFESKAQSLGQRAQATGKFSAVGDAQTSVVVMRKATSDDTVTELALDGGTTYFTCDNDTSYIVQAHVIGRNTANDSDSAAYVLEFEFDRGANAAASRISSITQRVVHEDTAGYDCTAVADTTNGRFAIKVTGAAATAIRWVARVTITQVTG